MIKIYSRKSKINPLIRAFEDYIAIYLNRVSKKNNAIRGQRIAMFANDWVGINISLFGVYEGEELSLIFDFLKPLHDIFKDGLALDIGANIGNHSVFFDRYFKSIFAFEPNPSTYSLLKFNSSFSNSIAAFDYGLGDISGKYSLYEDSENFGASSIGHNDAEGIKVEIKRLDDDVLEFNNLCLVKIDVEGFESNVVRGGRETIAKYQPVILIEQRKSDFEKGEPDAIKLLRDMGYSFCWKSSTKTPGGWICRRLKTLVDVFMGAGENEVITTSALIPAGDYSMIIAVPGKYWHVLTR